MIRFILGIWAFLLVAPAAAAQVESANPVAVETRQLVRMETGEGAIVLALDAAHAPITTANFLRYVDEAAGRDGVLSGFESGGLAQSGLRSGRYA